MYNKNKLRQCHTATGREKKTFRVYEDAVKWAKRMNKNPKVIYKQVAYKCSICLKFHTGKSKHNTLLKHKIDIYNINNITGYKF